MRTEDVYSKNLRKLKRAFKHGGKVVKSFKLKRQMARQTKLQRQQG